MRLHDTRDSSPALSVPAAVADAPRSRAPWLCALHMRAGLATEMPCCPMVTAVGGRQRMAWFALRLASKSPEQRARIQATRDSPALCRSVLSGRSHASGGGWVWLRAHPPVQCARGAPTVPMRAV